MSRRWRVFVANVFSAIRHLFLRSVFFPQYFLRSVFFPYSLFPQFRISVILLRISVFPVRISVFSFHNSGFRSVFLRLRSLSFGDISSNSTLSAVVFAEVAPAAEFARFQIICRSVTTGAQRAKMAMRAAMLRWFFAAFSLLNFMRQFGAFFVDGFITDVLINGSATHLSLNGIIFANSGRGCAVVFAEGAQAAEFAKV